VVVVIDDLSSAEIERFGGLSDVPPSTPRLDRLAEQGMAFPNTWGMPTCSPSRATMLTGLLPSQHGVGEALGPRQPGPLTWDHPLPEAIGLPSVALGKWHLGKIPESPMAMGFDRYSGAPDNFVNRPGQRPSHYRFAKWIDGVWTEVHRWSATDEIDDAIAALKAPSSLIWVGLHAPHMPFDGPPPELTHHREWTGDGSTKTSRYLASIEAIDTEIGRLVDAMDLQNSTLIVVGDNGMPAKVAHGGITPEQAKGSLHEGALTVPLWMVGRGVPGHGIREDLVSVADVYTTVLAIAGKTQHGERFGQDLRQPNAERVVVAQQFKGQRFRAAARQGHEKLVNEDGVFQAFTVHGLQEAPAAEENPMLRSFLSR